MESGLSYIPGQSQGPRRGGGAGRAIAYYFFGLIRFLRAPDDVGNV